MRMALVTDFWKKSDGGGIEKTLLKLVKIFASDYNINVKVIFRKGEDRENYSCKGSKISFIFKAKKHLQYISPDIIQVQGGWNYIIPALLYKRKSKAPIFYMFYSTITRELPWYKKIIYNYLLNKCDMVGFVSEFHETNIRETAKLNIKTATTIITSGVDKRVVDKADVLSFKRKFHVENGHPILLGMGLTAIEHKAKGAKKIIDAVKILSKDYPEIKLILTRDGAQSQMLKEYTHLQGLQDKVIFTGTISNSWVALTACDIYTHISFRESLGLAALEAMSIGKPVIVAQGGGLENVIKDGYDGILIEPQPEIIAQAVKQLIDDDNLSNNLSTNAINTIEDYFTWGHVAKRYVELYEKMMAGAGIP